MRIRVPIISLMLRKLLLLGFMSRLSLAVAISVLTWVTCHASEGVTDSPDHIVPLFPASGDSLYQGFLRVINHSGRSGEVEIRAYDDRGARFGPSTLRLDANETVHFNSTDLEEGSDAKGLSNGIGSSSGDWWLALSSNLDIEVLSYIRTKGDGFLTSMHDVVPLGGAGGYRVAFFNPASNYRQISRLRLVNTGERSAEVTISGIDGDGASPGGDVRVALHAGSAQTLSAQQLEAGAGLQGALGDGAGKWALRVESDGPLVVMNLLESPTGHLTNLSSGPVDQSSGVHRVPLFPSASHSSRQGFLRVINRSDVAGEVTVAAFDDSSTEYEPLTLSLGANQAAHFNSDDLELGNVRKGLSGSTGPGEGEWWLELSSALEIEVLAYVRFKTDGFLTSMHDTVSGEGGLHRVAFFNSASNVNQVSSLRLVNFGDSEADVTLTGIGDTSRPPEKTVALQVPAGGSRTLTAQQLEAGSEEFEGKLWYRTGKWQLVVESDQPIMVASLLSSPTGHLTNLSTVPAFSLAPANHAAFADRVGGNRVLESSNPANYVEFLPDGRFRETKGTDTHEGGYAYARTGADRATVEMNYDDGRSCDHKFAFTSRTAGSLSFACDGGTDGASNWMLVGAGSTAAGQPVAWTFAGDVQDEHKTMLREELGHVIGYFADGFGVRAEGFAALFGSDYEALEDAYKEATGVDLSAHAIPEPLGQWWVTASSAGGAILTMKDGLDDEGISSSVHAAVHEYFHVLQGQLASKFAELEGGERRWWLAHRSGAGVPQWLVEGTANHVDFVYSTTRPNRRTFIDRHSPFSDIGYANALGNLNYDDLRNSAEPSFSRCAFLHPYYYGLAFAATKHLTDIAPRGSHVEFFWALDDHPTWQQAFQATFGIDVEDFYAAFEEWLPSQIPSYDQVVFEVSWPDVEGNPLTRGELLSARASPSPWPDSLQSLSMGTGESLRHLTITYLAGDTWEGVVSLEWTNDQLTDHLLGWYKDGELTTQRAEATPIRFSSSTPDFNWTLPAHPSTLERLESCSRPCVLGNSGEVPRAFGESMRR